MLCLFHLSFLKNGNVSEARTEGSSGLEFGVRRPHTPTPSFSALCAGSLIPGLWGVSGILRSSRPNAILPWSLAGRMGFVFLRAHCKAHFGKMFVLYRLLRALVSHLRSWPCLVHHQSRNCLERLNCEEKTVATVATLEFPAQHQCNGGKCVFFPACLSQNLWIEMRHLKRIRRNKVLLVVSYFICIFWFFCVIE